VRVRCFDALDAFVTGTHNLSGWSDKVYHVALVGSMHIVEGQEENIVCTSYAVYVIDSDLETVSDC